MKSLTTYLSALVAVLFLVPAVSFADTTTPTASSIQSELNQIQTRLAGTLGTTTPSFLGTHVLTPGQVILEPDNALAIGFASLAHTNPTVVTSSTPRVELAEFLFQYNPCVTAVSTSTPGLCVNPNHHVSSQLALGQSTNYQNYLITLIGLSSTTATITVANPTLLMSLQNDLNSVSAELRSLLGN
ncbi:MAG: hypothetical protein P4M11_05880 [Candidatus Pacebacteria bacterium]|nr:hypothetical protein [Candidatus Paceibacterota bacterium]